MSTEFKAISKDCQPVKNKRYIIKNLQGEDVVASLIGNGSMSAWNIESGGYLYPSDVKEFKEITDDRH